ncbi:hypothetical protein [Rhizobium sp. YTU87027]|uniref:hypothetical protein n=1 Tax=Rhizobium sp. YTU87027 TaxID=3417741 RepID=UPI003D68D4F3
MTGNVTLLRQELDLTDRYWRAAPLSVGWPDPLMDNPSQTGVVTTAIERSSKTGCGAMSR